MTRLKIQVFGGSYNFIYMVWQKKSVFDLVMSVQLNTSDTQFQTKYISSDSLQ